MSVWDVLFVGADLVQSYYAVQIPPKSIGDAVRFFLEGSHVALGHSSSP